MHNADFMQASKSFSIFINLIGIIYCQNMTLWQRNSKMGGDAMKMRRNVQTTIWNVNTRRIRWQESNVCDLEIDFI